MAKIIRREWTSTGRPGGVCDMWRSVIRSRQRETGTQSVLGWTCEEDALKALSERQ